MIHAARQWLVIGVYVEKNVSLDHDRPSLGYATRPDSFSDWRPDLCAAPIVVDRATEPPRSTLGYGEGRTEQARRSAVGRGVQGAPAISVRIERCNDELLHLCREPAGHPVSGVLRRRKAGGQG